MLNLFQLLSATWAMGAVGLPVPDHLLPAQTCSIEFFLGDTNTVEAVCSGTLVSPTQLQTAGHCFETKDGSFPRHRVRCRNGETTQGTSVRFSEQYSPVIYARAEENLHRFDSALLELERPISLEGMKVASGRVAQKLVREAKTCAVFGYGGVHPTDPSFGRLRGVFVDPATISFSEDTPLLTQGLGGWNSGLVEPGDSGGTFACQNKAREWVLVANTSGRNYGYASIFAPLWVNEDIARVIRPNNGRYNRETAEFLRKQDESALDDEIKNLAKGLGGELAKRLIDMRNRGLSTKAVRAEIQRESQRILRGSIGGTVRVLPFSLVKLDFSNPENIRADRPNGRGHLQAESNPFSTVDHKFLRFTILEVKGDRAIGNLHLFGPSDFFVCQQNVLCDGGLYKNVSVPLSRLDASSLKMP